VHPSRRRGPALLAALTALAVLAAPHTPAAPAGAAPGPVRPPAPAASAASASADLDRWSVTDLGDGRYDVTWTAPTDLPLGSDRPTIAGPGLVFGPPTVAPDGRTVQAAVTAEAPPDPAELDVVLSGDRLDEPGADPVAPAAGGALVEPRTTLLPGTDPGRPGAFDTVTSDYELDPVKIAGMREPIEMVGHVVEPAADAATGERPLVLFMHGRHATCYDPEGGRDQGESWPCAALYAEIPSHLGYDYLQQVLASQGYTTVSVRVNGINAQDFRLEDGGAGARATITRRHLDHWVDRAAAPDSLVDLDRVVLVGHSRGGEGVDRASIRIPAGAPYRVAGQVLLAPTDFGAQSAPYVPTVTVLPYCDGDVFDLQGQQFTDNGRDLVTDDTSLKSSVLVMGANHNFFNTEWTPRTAVAPANDDWGGDPEEPCGRRHPDRLSAAEQRAVATAYVAGAAALFTRDDATLPLYDGSPVTVASVGDADVRSHALGGGRTVRRPGIEATPTLASGGATTRLCRGVVVFVGGPFGACGRSTRDAVAPHWAAAGSPVPTREFFELAWSEPGAVGGLRFDDPLDLASDRLELRTIVDPRGGPVDLDVRLTDSTGASTTVTPRSSTADGATLAPLLTGAGLTKLWAQPLLVDPAAGASAGVDLADLTDLSDIVSVELVARSDRGRLWVADLSAAPDALAAVPDVRLPILQLGELRVEEGDRPRSRVVRVPFEVDGQVTRPARFVVQTTGQERGSQQRFAVDLAPGQTSGSVPVQVAADAVAGYGNRTQISAWPITGMMTDDYLGRLVVDDDDPQPVLEVRPVQRRVVEGRPVVLEATISAPTSYDFGVYAEVVDGRGEDLRADDVPRSWLEDQGVPLEEPRAALHELYVGAYEAITPGEQAVRLTFPTSRDRRVEGRESLTVRFRVEGQRFRLTVAVVDPPGGRQR
jgi:hypothetical protein